MKQVVRVVRGSSRSRGPARAWFVAPLLVTSLAACGDFTDAPPDPSVAPLEIVANNPAAARCSLNRTEVGVGTHEVVVITEGVDAVVTVRDASGAVLLEQHGDTWPQAPAGDGSAEQGPAEGSTTGSAQLSLSAGTYDVTCRYPDGAEGSTSLRVTR